MRYLRDCPLGLLAGIALVFGLLTQQGIAEPSASTRVFDNWTKMIEAADVDGMIALFADDAVLTTPDGGAISGKEPNRAYLTGLFTQIKASSSSIKVEHEQISGPWATITASFQATWTDRAGSKMTERSRYVCVLKRTSSGEWRIWQFIYFPLAE